MAHYKLILSYDGTRYKGYQRQVDVPSVQGVVEAALRQLGWQEKSIRAAGRTDSGVHASGQTVAFHLDWKHSPSDLLGAINARLPRDVAAKRTSLVDADFHPRYDATARQYRYRIYCSPYRDPLRERYAWRVWPQVNFEKLQQVSIDLEGKHDFIAFGKAPKEGGSTVRTIQSTLWFCDGNPDDGCDIYYDVTANGFLYRMVRRLVYTQVAIASGKLEQKTIRKLLRTPPKYPVEGLAPPQGLTLINVSYPNC